MRGFCRFRQRGLPLTSAGPDGPCVTRKRKRTRGCVEEEWEVLCQAGALASPVLGAAGASPGVTARGTKVTGCGRFSGLTHRAGWHDGRPPAQTVWHMGCPFKRFNREEGVSIHLQREGVYQATLDCLPCSKSQAGDPEVCSKSQMACCISQVPCCISQEVCSISQGSLVFLGFFRNPKKKSHTSVAPGRRPLVR